MSVEADIGRKIMETIDSLRDDAADQAEFAELIVAAWQRRDYSWLADAAVITQREAESRHAEIGRKIMETIDSLRDDAADQAEFAGLISAAWQRRDYSWLADAAVITQREAQMMMGPSRNPKRNTGRGWIVSPDALLYRAVLARMITIDEARSPKFVAAAESAASHLRESWPEGEGFGSSDFTFLLQDFLSEAGVKTAWTGPGGSLERVTKNLGRNRKRTSRNAGRRTERVTIDGVPFIIEGSDRSGWSVWYGSYGGTAVPADVGHQPRRGWKSYAEAEAAARKIATDPYSSRHRRPVSNRKRKRTSRNGKKRTSRRAR